jgi:16S rRNA (cytidine1402-2'-O)-methyltransferase
MSSRNPLDSSNEVKRPWSAPLQAGLYVVATPIGNLGDISLRAADTLRRAELIACEDTRVTARLLQHLGIGTRMIPYHDHNGDRVRPKLLDAMQTQAVALVSDAGTPLISDPGYKLVRDARAAGITVTTIPGASAVMAALTVCGLPTDRFLFAGFLPNKSTARRSEIQKYLFVPATLVFFENPSRTADTLQDLSAVLGPRQAAITRELTKLHEEVRTGTLDELAQSAQDIPPRGEVVLVVAPPNDAAPMADGDIDDLISAALKRISVREASAEIAAITGIAKREIYARALALEKNK